MSVGSKLRGKVVIDTNNYYPQRDGQIAELDDESTTVSELLQAHLPEAIARAQDTGTMLAVLFLDLDRFKHINDSRGHEVGDKLLQEIAKRVRAAVRSGMPACTPCSRAG